MVVFSLRNRCAGAQNFAAPALSGDKTIFHHSPQKKNDISSLALQEIGLLELVLKLSLVNQVT